MEKLKEILKGFIATLIVMFGVFLFNFYLTNPVGIVSILVGLCGFFILFPAVKKWEDILSRKNANQK